MNRSAKKQHFPIALPVVNLLSPSVFEAMAARKIQRRLVAAAFVLMLVVAGGWGAQHLRAVQAKKLLTVERAETSRLTAANDDLAPVGTYVAEVAKQKNVVTKTMASEALMSRLLDDLRAATPVGVRIETMNAAVGGAVPTGKTGQGPSSANQCPAPNPFVKKVSVGCVILAGTATSRAAVGQFVTKLNTTGVFVAPYITTTSTADEKEVKFSGSVAVNKRVLSNRYADLDKLLETGGR
jgi:Tfp pilus assembly protein PilN